MPSDIRHFIASDTYLNAIFLTIAGLGVIALVYHLVQWWRYR